MSNIKQAAENKKLFAALKLPIAMVGVKYDPFADGFAKRLQAKFGVNMMQAVGLTELLREHLDSIEPALSSTDGLIAPVPVQ